jgi:hypothetical protein
LKRIALSGKNDWWWFLLGECLEAYGGVMGQFLNELSLED